MVPSILRARKVNLAISKPITPPDQVIPLPDEVYKGDRLSGDNLTPSDGYSSLVSLLTSLCIKLISSSHRG